MQHTKPQAYSLQAYSQQAAVTVDRAGGFRLQTQDTSSACAFSNGYLPNPACEPRWPVMYANISASAPSKRGGAFKKPTKHHQAKRSRRHVEFQFFRAIFCEFMLIAERQTPGDKRKITLTRLLFARDLVWFQAPGRSFAVDRLLASHQTPNSKSLLT